MDFIAAANVLTVVALFLATLATMGEGRHGHVRRQARLAQAGTALVCTVLAILVSLAWFDGLPGPGRLFGGGVVLLVVGMRWLRRVMLHGAGVRAVHQEAAAVPLPAETFILAGLAPAAFLLAAGALSVPLLPAAAAAVLGVLVGLAGTLIGDGVPSRLTWIARYLAGILLATMGMIWSAEAFDFHWGGMLAALGWLLPLLVLASLGVIALLHGLRDRGLSSLHDEDGKEDP